ncbi:uncharacterized protein BcabD6B2_24730 [Babesia caballi]|uniref:Uncharacterized protein n=1 Tax=Babesia caballi TaxID=5871 RepID=A0AAV4LSR8_BABCB|nr:hypothetical protein, conserved [Babesia caballi]
MARVLEVSNSMHGFSPPCSTKFSREITNCSRSILPSRTPRAFPPSAPSVRRKLRDTVAKFTVIEQHHFDIVAPQVPRVLPDEPHQLRRRLLSIVVVECAFLRKGALPGNRHPALARFVHDGMKDDFELRMRERARTVGAPLQRRALDRQIEVQRRVPPFEFRRQERVSSFGVVGPRYRD